MFTISYPLYEASASELASDLDLVTVTSGLTLPLAKDDREPRLAVSCLVVLLGV